MNQIEHLISSQNELGEGPLWDQRRGLLHWVDISRGEVHNYDPTSGEHAIDHIGIPIGCLGLRERGGFIMATRDGFAFWDSENNHLTPILDPETDRPDARFNDGAVDPSGRFWAGTMTPEGSNNHLYRLDSDLTVHTMESNIMISNGIGWSPDSSTMYFTDSPRRTIYAYDFDDETGSVQNRRVFIQLPDEPGVPDGLCVDHDGCIWSAQWDGRKIVRFDPDGKRVFELELPVQRPTSCTFGGSELDILYITSARIDLSTQDLEEQPFAGDVFVYETDTRGLGESHFLG